MLKVQGVSFLSAPWRKSRNNDADSSMYNLMLIKVKAIIFVNMLRLMHSCQYKLFKCSISSLWGKVERGRRSNGITVFKFLQAFHQILGTHNQSLFNQFVTFGYWERVKRKLSIERKFSDQMIMIVFITY